MRTTLFVAALALTAACADAPITAADLQADGQLREIAPSSQQSIHAASRTNQPAAQKAEHLRVTGLVAAQGDGPLEDANRFSLESEAIYLHLRADGLDAPRPVTYVWVHGEQRRETMGFLQPKDTISLAASLPLASFVEAASTREDSEVPPPVLTGTWEVEVYSADANGRSLVFEREFEVIEAEAFEALLALSQLEGESSDSASRSTK